MDSIKARKSPQSESENERTLLSEKTYRSRVNIFTRYVGGLKARALTIPTTLLLVYSLPISMCTVVLYNIANDIITPPSHFSCAYPYPESDSTAYSAVTIIQNVLYLIIPIAGWISDTKIGRSNAVYLSLWLGWVGTLLQCISSCFQYSSCGIIASVGKYGISGIAVIFILVSMAFMYANILAYGMDQLLTDLNAKIRAFIYWYVWIMFFIGNISSYTSFQDITTYHTGTLAVAVTSFSLFSLSLCLHFQLYHKFEHIPIPNSYQMVINVLKYYVQHKYPKQRSAFTYWEEELPKRIDFAKEKYGGPYSHESVENVKTFLRILAVLAALSLFLIASDPFTNGITSFVSQFKGGYKDLYGNAKFTIWFIGDNVILIIVPLLELLILPLFPKLEYFLINSLKGLGIAMICLILSIVFVLLINLIGRLEEPNENIPCFATWTFGSPTLNISFWILLIPSILAGIADALTFLCIFEFLCSQSPFGMHGMLIGLFWFLRAIYINVGSCVTITFNKLKLLDYPPNLSCTFWFTLILGLTAFMGLVAYVIAAYWYVKRIRNDNLNLHTAIEEHFEHQLIHENSFMHDKDIEVIVKEY